MEAVFREILAMSLSASLLAALVMLLRWGFRRVPKWVHCVLWALVAVRLICPSLPQSQLSMVPPPAAEGKCALGSSPCAPSLPRCPRFSLRQR